MNKESHNETDPRTGGREVCIMPWNDHVVAEGYIEVDDD